MLPIVKLSDLFEVYRSATSVKRYSKSFMFKHENLLEHLGFVTLSAYIIYNNWLVLNTTTSDLFKLDVLLSYALSHDMEEIVTGDTLRTVKYSSKEMSTLFKKMEESAIIDLSKKLNCDNTIVNDWKLSKRGSSIESYFIKYLDMVSVLMKCEEEIIYLNNDSFINVFTEFYTELNTLFSELKLQFTEYVQNSIESSVESRNLIDYYSMLCDSATELMLKVHDYIHQRKSSYR